MKIYHLVSNKVWGGGEQYVYDLSAQLIAEGNYVEVVCRNSPIITSRFRELEIPISTLPLKGITDIDSAKRLANIIKKGAIIVHVHNFKDAFTACIARKLSENKDVKVIMTRHLVKKGKNSVLYHKLYKSLDKIIFVSELARNEFLLGKPKIDPCKLQVIHNSILPDKTSNEVANISTIYNIPSVKTLVMYHGRLAKEKGVDILLRAVSLLDKSKFHLLLAGIGSNDYVEYLNTIVVSNRLQDNVTFIGYVKTVQPIIDQCDFGVLPSVARESLGLANMEYMMMGKAQICSNNGAQTEYLVNNETAVFVSPENQFELALAIENLLDSPQISVEIGRKAKIKFDSELSYSHFYDQIKQVYQNL